MLLIVSLKSILKENDLYIKILTHHVRLLISWHGLLVELNTRLSQEVLHLLSLVGREVLRCLLLRHLFVSDFEGERIGVGGTS